MKVYLIISFLTFALFSSQSHNCNHDKLPYHKLLKPPQVKPLALRQLAETNWMPIRIYLDFTTLDSCTNISLDLRNKMKEILNKAVSIFAKLLSVKRTQPIQLHQGVCWNLVKISPEAAKGIDADLIIFPLINRSFENSLAYASPCQYDEQSGRPNVGMITFVEIAFDISKLGYFDRYVHIALHELYHVLGFSNTFFHSFIDESGVKIPYEKVVKKQVINGITKNFIITPKVVQYAKKHFNCKDLIGVELENQGGGGTAGSHWEGRQMNGDFMTGGLNYELAISEISLALMEDSGYYKVNYYTGGIFRFGKNEGCSFLSKPCLINGRTNFPNEFCEIDNALGCSAASIERGVCAIFDQPSRIPEEYQYYAGYPRTGGLVFNDYCPSLVQFRSDYNSMSCISGKKLIEFEETGETFNSQSICFMSDLFKDSLLREKYPMCYETDCDYENSTMKVKLYNITLTCPKEGGLVISSDEAVKGSLICPKFNMVCTNREKCSSLIDCVDKESIALDSSYDYFNKSRNSV